MKVLFREERVRIMRVSDSCWTPAVFLSAAFPRGSVTGTASLCVVGALHTGGSQGPLCTLTEQRVGASHVSHPVWELQLPQAWLQCRVHGALLVHLSLTLSFRFLPPPRTFSRLSRPGRSLKGHTPNTHLTHSHRLRNSDRLTRLTNLSINSLVR